MPTLATKGKPFRRKYPAFAIFILFGFLLIGGSFLTLSPKLAQRLGAKIADILQVQGRWLGFVPVYYDPMPDYTPLATPLIQTRPVKGPLRPHPTNPRYFTDGSGKVIYLTGSHTWTNLQEVGDSDPPLPFNYTEFLDILEAHHHNFFRLWRWEQTRWGSWNGIDGLRYEPHPYPRPGPGTALDGKPKFDLSQFNQAYFDRMRERIQQAGQRGFYVSVMLFDGWSIEDKGLWGNNPWPGHPFNQANNINNVNGDPNNDGQGLELHSMSDPTTMALQEDYVRKVIDTVNDLDNVLYEISNESSSQAIEWHYHMINLIKAYESTKQKQHPVGMTGLWWPNSSYEEANAPLYASPADWISPLGELYNRPIATGDKVIIADTDHLCGICGDRVWVWMSFTRGENPLFMDVWSCAPWWYPNDCNRPTWPSLRQNLGYTRDYALRMNLAAMTPSYDIASTGHALANAAESNAEYLIYAPSGGEFTVNLTATPGELNVEWFNPETGATTMGDPVVGGAQRPFTPPFAGDVVLYLYQTPTAAYQLHTPIIGNGAVTVEPPGPYHSGQEVSLTANPASGWRFANWGGDFFHTENPFLFTISSDTTITATFVPEEPTFYTITLAVEGEGSIALTPIGPFTSGEIITLTATPEAGWRFAGWRGAQVTSTNPLTIAIAGNLVFTATFALNEPVKPYSLSVSTDGDGVVVVAPSGPYAHGQKISLQAIPTTTWRFDRWSGDYHGQDNPTHYTITANSVITAHFLPITAPVTYSLSISVEGEGVVELSAPAPYTSGQVISLTATPAAGWQFAGWSGAFNTLANPAIFTITADSMITATFTQLSTAPPLTLTVHIQGDGQVAIHPDGPYANGQPITLTALPDAGWEFLSWSGQNSLENPLSFVMTESLVITAHFSLLHPAPAYSLTIAIQGEGVILPAPTGPYLSGQMVELTALPSPDWAFIQWSGDLRGSENPKVFAIFANTQVTGTFRLLTTEAPYTLLLFTHGQGTILSEPAAPYRPNQTVHLTAKPESGWNFVGWQGDRISTDNPLQLIISDTLQLTATFSINLAYLPLIQTSSD